MGNPGGAKAQARLGRYELLARLATGGMGEIFLARLSGAEGFEKLYVVKRILAHLADDARFRQMLIAEARIASKMSHPNICQVFELGETDGQLYIVMEYLEGVSLLPLLRRFSKDQVALDLGFIACVLQQTTDAMNYAHELNDRDGENLDIIHRDVTPSNIFLTEAGVAKVLDFGIAKARGASTQTQEGTVKGKYAYMAPEQLRGSSIDRRVDIFSMGVVLYEMLALRRLFQRKTDYLTFRAVMEQPIPDIRRYRPDTPDGVADALFRALDRDPSNRFETARQFGSAVLDGLRGIRPWTQGELSDFVKQHFAREIGKRSAQVASVVERAPMSASTRSTMPLLITPDDNNDDDDPDDDDGFPSVETDVSGAPSWMPRPTPTPTQPQFPLSTDFAVNTGSGTPPPFGAEPTGSLPSLKPLHGALGIGAATGSFVVVQHKRSIVWPMLAVAMVAIAAGALFLVWQQMQRQKPAEIKITQESAVDHGSKDHASGAKPDQTHDMVADTGSPAAVDRPDAPNGSGGVAPAPKKPARAVKPKTFVDGVNDAIAAKKPDMVRCLNDHRDGIPKHAISAAISIAADGRAKHVQMTPAALDAAPLGKCLRNVLMTGSFPASTKDTVVNVPLTPKTT